MAKRLLRFGTACLAALLACSASVAMAAEVTPRMLVPVGHTVGIKMSTVITIFTRLRIVWDYYKHRLKMAQ